MEIWKGHMTASHNIAGLAALIAGNTAKETRISEEAAMDTIENADLFQSAHIRVRTKVCWMGLELKQ